MTNSIETLFAEANSDNHYPKLIEGDPLVNGNWIKFELANGRMLSFLPEGRRAETFILRDSDEMVAHSVRYRDEEGDIRTHIYSYFARNDYPEWKNADKNPHLELDFEVSKWGDLQTVSLRHCLKSFDPERKDKSWREIPVYGDKTPHSGNDDFILDENDMIQTLNRFYDYAIGTIVRGNQPNFEALNALFDEPFVEPSMVDTSDIRKGPFGNFAV